MALKIKLKLTLTPEQFDELVPILLRMNLIHEKLPKLEGPAPASSSAPDNDGPFGPPPAREYPWKGVPDPVAPPPPPPAPASSSAEDAPPPPPPPPGPESDEGDDAPGPDVSGVLDSDGLPWDSRIHSSSRKTLKKTGAWKPLRGVSAETVAAVTAELRARPATKSPAPAAPAAPVTPTATQSPAPAAPAAPAAPIAPPPAAPSGPCETFQDLIKRVTVAKITNEALNQALKIEGVEGLAILAATPEKIPAVARRLGIGA